MARQSAHQDDGIACRKAAAPFGRAGTYDLPSMIRLIQDSTPTQGWIGYASHLRRTRQDRRSRPYRSRRNI